MILAKPVTRDTGMVLIAAGTVLTESLIMRLENMGIEQIVVEGTPVDMGDGSGSEAQKKSWNIWIICSVILQTTNICKK